MTILSTAALATMPISYALWRRWMGGITPIVILGPATPWRRAWAWIKGRLASAPRSSIISVAWVPALPLFAVMPWYQAVVAIAATYAQMLPPHHGLIDAGRVDGTALADSAGLTLRYSIGPTVLLAACLFHLTLWGAGLPPAFPYPYGVLAMLCGPCCSMAYDAAWIAHGEGVCAAPTAVGEIGIGFFWGLALALIGISGSAG